MLGYPIRKEIRDKLDSLRSDLSRMTRDSKKIYSPREKSKKDKYQESVIQTPYVFMASAPIFEEDKEKRLDPDVTPQGTIILGNQEYSKNKFPILGDSFLETSYGIDLYKARGFQTYRPNAGVKSLTSEYLSSNNVQFVRHITVNWTCFSLTDLDILSERFLTLGRKVYVEWGRTKDEKTRPTLLDKDGKVNISDLNLSGTKEEKEKRQTELENMSEATRLREKVLSIGNGNFDAVVGFINNFNFSSREDGGFDCTTEITIQGVNALDGPTDVSNSNQDDGEEKPKEKFIKNTDAPLSEINFQNALTNLPKSAKSICDSEPVATEVVFKNYTTADNYFPPLPAEYEGYYKLWREGVIGYNQLQEAFTNAVNSNPNLQLAIGTVTNVNKYLLDWFRGDTGTTTEELKKQLEEGYIAPAYFENAKQRNQEILVDRDKNFILTYNFGVKDDKVTIDDLRNNNTQNVEQYFQKFAEGNIGVIDKFAAGLSKYEEIDPEKSWVRWGWFEDNILNRYFAILEENSGEKVSYFRSITENKSVNIKSHKHFRTTDISKFIFPGKFEIDKGFIDENGNVVSMKKTNEQRVQKRKEDIFDKISDLDKTKDDDIEQEKVLFNQIRQIEENKKLADSLQNQTIEEIQKEVSNNWTNYDLTEPLRTPDERLDLTSEGYEPYLYLKALDKKVKEFKEFSNFDGDSGKLRNIMINMKHLQDVFSNKSATLGENMNTLFESLANESGGLIDLVISADNREDDGRLVIQERGFDSAEAKRIEQLENNPGLIYEFPVWQNDSYVLTQELASDISSENYKILLSKAYDERIQLEKKKGISLVHQAQISQISPGTSPENSRYKSIAGVKPAFQILPNYGQKIGDETKDLDGDGAPELTNHFELTDKKGELFESNRKLRVEKDLERRNNIFSETDIAYTAEGKLKSFLNKNMRQETKFKTVARKDEKTGRRYIAKIPNVDDYGMVGITNTLTLRGIAGIVPSNLFTTTYLPRKFKESCHFYATEVNQSIDSNTWTTSITGRMVWKYIQEPIKIIEGAYNKPVLKIPESLTQPITSRFTRPGGITADRITETTLDRILRENK